MMFKNFSFLFGLLAIFYSAAAGSLADENILVPITDYHLTGTGEEVLVIIPCFSCRWKSFDTFIERNREKYRILAVTLPGHGGTGFPEIPLNTAGTPWHDNAWQAVANLMEELSIERATLVTHSFGTDIGVHLAFQRPDSFKAFIAIDSNPTDPLDQGRKTLEERLATAREYREKFMEPLLDPDAWINFNAARSIQNPERRLLYHGMFVATEKEVVFQYWRESLIQDINPEFRALNMPYFDLQTISAAAEDQEAARNKHLTSLQETGTPKGYQATFIFQSSHFMMEERPEVLDRMIEEIVFEGTTPDNWRPNEE